MNAINLPTDAKRFEMFNSFPPAYCRLQPIVGLHRYLNGQWPQLCLGVPQLPQEVPKQAFLSLVRSVFYFGWEGVKAELMAASWRRLLWGSSEDHF